MEATMQCPTIDREMPVERCLEYQQPRISEDSWNKGELTVYPCCTGCRTGELLRLGKQDEAIKSAEKEEKGMEIKKQCRRCKKMKPLEEFCRDKKAKDGHRNVCLECNRAYQNDWAGGKGKKAAKSEPLKSEPQNIKQETAEPQKVKAAPVPVAAPEKQVEPDPRQETPAPVVPQDEDQVLENQLLLDFSCYPEVLNEIKRIAHHEERPPEVQARFMLKRLLQDGLGDEVRAAGGSGCPVPLPLYGYEPMFLQRRQPNPAGSDAREDNMVCG